MSNSNFKPKLTSTGYFGLSCQIAPSSVTGLPCFLIPEYPVEVNFFVDQDRLSTAAGPSYQQAHPSEQPAELSAPGLQQIGR
ncbi:hypothetical protein ACLOJK_005878 [Asimina triloba]